MDLNTLMHKAETVLNEKDLKKLKKLMAIAHFEYDLRMLQQEIDKHERFVPTKLYTAFQVKEQQYKEKIAALN